MSETALVEVGLAILGVLLTVIGYFLSQKDAKQEELIKDLYRKHEADERELTHLRIQIADGYHKKPEIDSKIEKLEKSIIEGFKHLGERFDSRFDLMAKALTEHITHEDRRGQ